MTQLQSKRAPIVENEDLCVKCGICCDGTLFREAPFFDQDLPLLANAPDLRFHDESKTVFVLPCPYHQGCCSIYDKRFTVCRNYRCKLVREKIEGHVSEAEARAVVDQAKRLVAAIQTRDPEAQHYDGRKRLRRELAARLVDAPPDERANIASRLLQMIALDELLATRFRKRKQVASSDPRSED